MQRVSCQAVVGSIPTAGSLLKNHARPEGRVFVVGHETPRTGFEIEVQVRDGSRLELNLAARCCLLVARSWARRWWVRCRSATSKRPELITDVSLLELGLRRGEPWEVAETVPGILR
jgi:hypothetical protein